MSLHPFHNQILTPPSSEISNTSRFNHKKLSTFIEQNTFQKNQPSNQKFVRNTSKQKHKTFAVIDSKTKPLYKLSNNDERKVLLLLGLAQQFIDKYENKKFHHQQTQRQKKQDRKKMLNLTSASVFKIIEPKNHFNQQQQEAYSFFLSIRNSIKDSYKKIIFKQMKKSTQKFDQIMSKDDLFNNQKNQVQKTRSSLNMPYTYNEKLQPATFITCDFNNTSQSGASPQNDLMNVSSFPQNMTDILKQSKSQSLQKFHALKVKSQRSRLRIHPVANRFQSRRKQQIRAFMQLNEKTEHLQNFRSESGKFFKFNENLKITIKNVNFCRIVLLAKKKTLLQQLSRLGNEYYFKQQNQKIKQTKTIQIKRSNSKQSNRQNGKIVKKQSQLSLQQITFSPFKQKAIRIMGYIEQTVKFFSSIEWFILEFIKRDKSYQNYLHENEIKLKLKGNLKFTEKQKYFDRFVDECFHMSELARIYFNVLNQMMHFNQSIHELKIVNKDNLQRQTKMLIQLRYTIIYLQKQCQNTSQTSYFIQNGYQQTDSKNEFYKTNFSQQIPNRQSSTVAGKRMSTTLKFNGTIGLLLEQCANECIKEPQMAKKNSKMNMSMDVLRPLNQMNTHLKRVPSEIIRKPVQKIKIHKKTYSTKKEQIDMNQIWKTFYDKKFSSNSIRQKLY